MMKAILQKAPGGAETLYLGQSARPALRPEALLVRVKAAGLNRADIVQRQASTLLRRARAPSWDLKCTRSFHPLKETSAEPSSFILKAGIVEEVGSSVTGWKVGDRCMALLGGGGYAQHVLVPAAQAMRIPAKLSFEDAAAIPEAFLTAYQTLISIGNANEGQKDVLIHAAASGVGTAALQLLRQLPSVQSFVTAGSQEKIDYCLSLGAKAGANYKEGPWSKSAMMAQTRSGKGVDLILDPVGQGYFQQDLDALNLEGKMVLIGFLSGNATKEGVNLGPILQKRLSIQGTTLRNRSADYKAKLVADFSSFSAGMFEDGRLRPIVSLIFNWEDIAAAHAFMEEDKNIGKIIITGMNPDE